VSFDLELRGRRALVTAGTKGVGAAVVDVLRGAGAIVVATAWGLTNRRNRPLTSQAIGMLLRNRLYAGIVDVPEYGVRSKRVTSSR